MPHWLASRLPDGWTGWHLAVTGVVLGVVSAFVSGVVVALVLARLPADYFINPAAREAVRDRNPILRIVFVLGRNLFGYLLIVLGVLLSFPGVPGQGVLTILMGVMLIDFPGKFRVERWLVSRRVALRAINHVRARQGRPPLQLEAGEMAPPSA